MENKSNLESFSLILFIVYIIWIVTGDDTPSDQLNAFKNSYYSLSYLVLWGIIINVHKLYMTFYKMNNNFILNHLYATLALFGLQLIMNLFNWKEIGLM